MNMPTPGLQTPTKRRKGVLYVISAPSGAGKTSICREILKMMPELHQSISYTTRMIRAGEEDGADYHFISRSAFDQMVADGEFAEWAEVHGNCYGTAKANLQKASDAGADILLEIDYQGADQLRHSGLDGVFIFILPPDMNELRTRLDIRNTDDEEVIERRMVNARGEIAESVKFDYLVVNSELGKAVDAVRSIMIAESVRKDRIINTLPEEFGLK